MLYLSEWLKIGGLCHLVQVVRLYSDIDISENAIIVCQLKEEEAVKVGEKFVILYYTYSCRALVGSHVSLVRGHEGTRGKVKYSKSTLPGLPRGALAYELRITNYDTLRTLLTLE